MNEKKQRIYKNLFINKISRINCTVSFWSQQKNKNVFNFYNPMDHK